MERHLLQSPNGGGCKTTIRTLTEYREVEKAYLNNRENGKREEAFTIKASKCKSQMENSGEIAKNLLRR
jgi:hypothetical protein